jgi:cytochrome b subunit of formate dehydrogenase
MTPQRVKIFSLFERFWHWTQMLLIFSLLITGFGLHGFHSMFDFEDAVAVIAQYAPQAGDGRNEVAPGAGREQPEYAEDP